MISSSNVSARAGAAGNVNVYVAGSVVSEADLVQAVSDGLLNRSLSGSPSAIGEAGVVKLVVRDKKNDTSNEYAIVVGETDQEFTFNFKVENIKIIPGAYDVVVSSKLLSQFTNTRYNLKYYIALEPDSTFG